MAQRNGTIEYVVNPHTGRMMRKDRRAHKRWRKNNQNVPEPETMTIYSGARACPEHPAPSLPPRSQRGSSAPPRLFRTLRRVKHNPPMIPPPSQSPLPMNPEDDEKQLSLSPPPLRRCDAWTHQMFQDQLSPAGLSLPSVPEEPEQPDEVPMLEDDDWLGEDLLQRYGPELLSAYTDQQVDFMQEIANKLDQSQLQASASKQLFRRVLRVCTVQ